MKITFAAVRDVIVFFGGACLMTYEVIWQPEPRLVILGLAATMLGLPGTLGMDRILNRGADPPPPPSSPAREREPRP